MSGIFVQCQRSMVFGMKVTKVSKALTHLVFDRVKMVSSAGQHLVLHLYRRREIQHIGEVTVFIIDI